MKRQATALACALIAVATAPGAHSQQDTQMATLQDYVRDRIVFLVAEGQTPTGVPMRSEATGFFVNELGNILTVYHLLTKLGDIDPASIKIEAHIGSKNSPAIPVSVYDARENRDILLLDMADGDAGKPLCIEPNFQPARLQRPLFTTGFSSVLATVSGQISQVFTRVKSTPSRTGAAAGSFPLTGERPQWPGSGTGQSKGAKHAVI